MRRAGNDRTRQRMRDDHGQLSLDGLVAGRPAPARARVAVPAPAVRQAPPVAGAVAPAGATLDQVIAGAWRALGAQRVAGCPVCGGTLHAAAGGREGRCGDCGTTLA